MGHWMYCWIFHWVIGYWVLSYYSDLTLSQEFQPMVPQLSKKAAIPFAKSLATASCCSSKTGPWATGLHSRVPCCPCQCNLRCWSELCVAHDWKYKFVCMRSCMCLRPILKPYDSFHKTDLFKASQIFSNVKCVYIFPVIADESVFTAVFNNIR